VTGGNLGLRRHYLTAGSGKNTETVSEDRMLVLPKKDVLNGSSYRCSTGQLGQLEKPGQVPGKRTRGGGGGGGQVRQRMATAKRTSLHGNGAPYKGRETSMFKKRTTGTFLDTGEPEKYGGLYPKGGVLAHLKKPNGHGEKVH